ncbi:MAG: hypothetical protein R2827_09935 [Bdellovibrionales bacterium]
MNYKERTTCILFGDGAYELLSYQEPSSTCSFGDFIQDIVLQRGNMEKLLYLPMGGSANPPSHEFIDKDMHTVEMNGREIFKQAVRTMGKAAQITLETNDMDYEDVDWFIPHQANSDY